MDITALIIIVLAGLLAIGGVLYFAVLGPAAQERIKLHRQARLDYQNARGAVHLKLMREALDRHQRAHQRCRSAIDEARKQHADVETRRDRELRQTLEAHILRTRLQEIPGIGQAYAAQLQHYAQNNQGLSSLRSASYHVIGIGETRQVAVNTWVADYEAQMPALLAGDFPNKAAIQQQAAADLAAIVTEIDKLTAEETTLATRLTQLQAEIDPLAQVTPNAFYRALQSPESMSEAVERYLRGAFAEWEPVPDWFKETVEGVSD